MVGFFQDEFNFQSRDPHHEIAQNKCKFFSKHHHLKYQVKYQVNKSSKRLPEQIINHGSVGKGLFAEVFRIGIGKAENEYALKRIKLERIKIKI